MRKLALLLALVVGLVGCSSTPPPEPESPKPTFVCVYKLVGTAEDQVRCQQMNATVYLDALATRFPLSWKRIDTIPEGAAERLSLLIKEDAQYLVMVKVGVTKGGSNIGITCEATLLAPDGDASVNAGGSGPVGHDALGGGLDNVVPAREAGQRLVTKICSAFPKQAPPRSKEELVRLRDQGLDAPILQALAEADKVNAGGDVAFAWGLVGKALARAQELKHADTITKAKEKQEALRDAYTTYLIKTVQEATTSGNPEIAFGYAAQLAAVASSSRSDAVTKVRGEVFTSATTAIRKKLAADAPEEAEALADLTAKAMPDKAQDLAAVRAEITEKKKAIAASLTEQAGQLETKQCYKALALLKRAVALDPDNKKATELLATVRELVKASTPTYIKDVHAQVEGDGYLVWFTLANEKGEMVAAPGRAAIFIKEVCSSEVEHNQYANRETNKVELPLFSFGEQVDVDSFEVREVGIGGAGGKRLMHICKRAPFSSFKKYDQTARMMYSVGTPLYNLVTVQFTPEQGEMIQGKEKAPLHR